MSKKRKPWFSQNDAAFMSCGNNIQHPLRGSCTDFICTWPASSHRNITTNQTSSKVPGHTTIKKKKRSGTHHFLQFHLQKYANSHSTYQWWLQKLCSSYLLSFPWDMNAAFHIMFSLLLMKCSSTGRLSTHGRQTLKAQRVSSALDQSHQDGMLQSSHCCPPRAVAHCLTSGL